MDALLAGYAAGALNPYLHALVESHLILSPENRDAVDALEAAVGDAIETIEPNVQNRAARDHVLAAIYAGGWYGQARPASIDPDLPEPIARLVGAPLDSIRWRFAAPGVREHKLHDEGGLTVSLIRVKAGKRLPHHTHEGHEATLVLKGSFHDHSGRYGRGDVALADPSVDHRPIAGREEPCVCFVVTDAPLKLTGPIGRWIQSAFGG
ncbi:ChrR family anti-sigma-E factor [Methylopila sp. M107]|uniref:ChrR family anti-sigma-E factor n=1 Tax=Methylopila sp. M107 TaxID=1101190 RepID=UPI00037FBDCD|nr:ChrR family anti-sigma-E factor [Methylopila sp. M107]